MNTELASKILAKAKLHFKVEMFHCYDGMSSGLENDLEEWNDHWQNFGERIRLLNEVRSLKALHLFIIEEQGMPLDPVEYGDYEKFLGYILEAILNEKDS